MWRLSSLCNCFVYKAICRECRGLKLDSGRLPEVHVILKKINEKTTKQLTHSDDGANCRWAENMLLI